MKVDASERQTTNLDIYRRPAHRGTSRMLHGLELLGVPFAVRTAGPDFVRGHGLGRLQERWDYLWTPATDGSLAEASVFGSTLPEAVRAKFAVVVREFEQSSDRVSSWAAVALLAHACVLGLHDHVDAGPPAGPGRDRVGRRRSTRSPRRPRISACSGSRGNRSRRGSWTRSRT